MKRFLISVMISYGLCLAFMDIINSFIYIHRSSFVFGILTGIILLSIMEWIIGKFNKAEELEEKNKKKEEKNEIDKMDSNTLH